MRKVNKRASRSMEVILTNMYWSSFRVYQYILDQSSSDENNHLKVMDA